jgi:hypothetical protein
MGQTPNGKEDLPQNLWVDEITGRRESGLLTEVLSAMVA